MPLQGHTGTYPHQDGRNERLAILLGHECRGVLFTGIAIEVPAIYQLLAELLAQALVCGCGLVVFPICYLGIGHDVV